MESIATVAFIAGAAGVAYSTRSHAAADNHGAEELATHKPNKKKKKKQSTPDNFSTAPPVVPLPVIVPGEFEPAAQAATLTPDEPPHGQPSAKGKKSKKKKPQAQDFQHSNSDVGSSISRASHSPTGTAPSVLRPGAPGLSGPRPTKSLEASTTLSVDTDGSWTRVGSARRSRAAATSSSIADETHTSAWADPTTSDAGVTTSANTETSSPVASNAELADTGLDSPARPIDNRKTLAEKSLHKQRRTNVYELSVLVLQQPCVYSDQHLFAYLAWLKLRTTPSYLV